MAEERKLEEEGGTKNAFYFYQNITKLVIYLYIDICWDFLAVFKLCA